MSAPVEVTSYTELMAGIQAQIAALGIRQQDFDDLAGFAPGLSGKVFGPSQVKRLGPEKLFDALRAAGLRLRIEVDPQQEAKMKARIAENFNPRIAAQARMQNHASPMSTQQLSRVFKHLSRLGAKARMKKMTKAERSAHAKHAATQRWIKHRKKLRAAMKASRSRNRRLELQRYGTMVTLQG